jgi:hypothetical protein
VRVIVYVVRPFRDLAIEAQIERKVFDEISNPCDREVDKDDHDNDAEFV